MANKLNDKAWDIGFHKEIGDESNPTWSVVVGGTSFALHFVDPLNAGTDFAVSANTEPTLYVHGSSAAPTQYLKLSYNTISGTALQIEGVGTAIKLSNASSWIVAGSAGGTFTSLGPSGMGSTIQDWLMVLNSDGSQRYIPAWGK